MAKATRDLEHKTSEKKVQAKKYFNHVHYFSLKPTN